MPKSPSHPFLFGIYPGGPVGAETGLLQGLPDDPAKVHSLLDDLQGDSPCFIVRCYDSVQDAGSPLAAIDRYTLFNFLGISTADYQPKPAFSVIRTLIHELGIQSS